MTASGSDAAFAAAEESYADLGVDVDRAVSQARSVELSVQCWQGDDVRGFEADSGPLDGGLTVTGSYPGRAGTLAELRSDLDLAMSLAPGRHRVNLHAMYADTDGRQVDRRRLRIEHFRSWIEWAAERRLGLDVCATLFSHPMASSGLTLSHSDRAVREYWIDHVRACRLIGAEMGSRLGSPTVHDLWIPDGMKDECADRYGHRLRLIDSLDAIYEESGNPTQLLDALESKLFGIGSEAFVVGSHELYLGYCQKRGLMPCLDTGHFHPTESVADKISALLPFHSGLLVHVSRGLRWDSDHVVIVDDALLALVSEIVRCEALGRVRLALDYFDATINRVAAWVIGMRAVRMALLRALLAPTARLRALEENGDYTGRLAMLEQSKAMPWVAVWHELCVREDVPGDLSWLDQVRRYEAAVQRQRGA